MSIALYALYSDPESAQRAVAALRKANISESQIRVVSNEPFDEHDFGSHGAKSAMPWLAVLGGVLGGLSGYSLAVLTQRAYPLPTGGMPIVTAWTNGIITYELTMLGAIAITLLTLLMSARLPNWNRQLYDPAVSDGKILVGVVNPAPESRVKVQKGLQEAGNGEVREFVTN